MKFTEANKEEMTEAERAVMVAAERQKRIMRLALKGRSSLINELRRRRRPTDMTWEETAEVAKRSAYDIAVFLVDLEDAKEK